MSYDVTIHTITISELQHFLVEPSLNPQLGPSRAMELSAGRNDRLVRELYSEMNSWSDSPVGGSEIASTWRFAAAIIGGYLHPYWYARQQAISLLPEVCASQRDALFSPISSFLTLQGCDGPERPLIFCGNYSASGLIEPRRFPQLDAFLQHTEGSTDDNPLASSKCLVGSQGALAIKSAIAYASQVGGVIIEATDVIVPLKNEALAPLQNLRTQI